MWTASGRRMRWKRGSTASSPRFAARKRRECELEGNMYRGMIIRKTSEQIDAMAEAGKIQARCLRILRSKARPGVTTKELDEAAEKFIRSQGAIPSFKGYRGYPASICTSPNSMVVHGIPGPYQLAEGDVLSVDVGVTLGGFVGDSAYTFPVGEISDDAQKLLDAGQAALAAGIEQARPGNHLSDIGHAVQKATEQ